MNSLIRRNIPVWSVLIIYIFVCSWSGVIHFYSRPLHFYLLLLALLTYLFTLSISGATFPRRLYSGSDVLIVFALIWLALNTVLLPNDKSINFLLAYFYIFGVGYLCLKPLLYKNISIKTFLRTNYYAVMFVAAFAIVELCLALFSSIVIQDYLPRVTPTGATYLGFLLRSYGLSVEPTNLALYFNTLGPFALYYVWNVMGGRFPIKLMVSAIMASGLIVTFSASGYFFFAFALMVVTVLKYGRQILSVLVSRYNAPAKGWFSQNVIFKFTTLMMACFVIIVVVTSVPIMANSAKYYLTPIYNKITFKNAGSVSGSVSDRTGLWTKSLNEVYEAPLFGSGLGFYSANDRGSSVNWYLFLAAETGIVTVILFVLFLLSVFFTIIKSNVAMKYYYLFGFVAASGHFATISTIQDPFLWILISVFFVDRIRTEHLAFSYRNYNKFRSDRVIDD